MISLVPLMLAAPALIPRPSHMVVGDGVFTLAPNARIVATALSQLTAERVQQALRVPTGFNLPIVRQAKPGDLVVTLDGARADLGREGYRLTVDKGGVAIRAADEAGAFYALQTLKQLLPPAVYRRAPVAGMVWTLPFVQIEDVPRFSWRGSHLDVGRHFMPKEYLLKHLDLMAVHKLNVFHLHLTDDQGWRMEIKRYPRLTEVGAFRKDTMLRYDPPVFEGKPHGGFYTQDDLREVVAYAAERFITVVPEIEMPGHAQAAIAAYPELGNTGEPLEVGTRWGVIENVFNVEDSTIEFLQNVLAEVMAVFPSQFIHVGGDECPKTQWKASPKAQEKMRQLGLKDEHELQSWFVRQMDAFLDRHGRRLIGWDEILEGGLAPGATVMSWRGTEGGIAAARAGHDVVMAPTSHTYLDYYQAKPVEDEPWAIGGYLPLETVYSFEPVPGSLTPEQARHVLGAQAQVWTEYIRSPKHVEYMAYPRLCALAEVVWSPREGKDFADFSSRLGAHGTRLSVLDVNYRR